jgi:hypothetical protein
VHDRFAVAGYCELVNTLVTSGVFEQLSDYEFLMGLQVPVVFTQYDVG